MSTFDTSKAAYGCLFCRTGNEKQLVQLLQMDNPDIRIVAAEKLRRRRQGKQIVHETVLLFPGYLFFQAANDFPVREFTKRQDVFKVLYSSSGKWQLTGDDEIFARWLFAQEGVIGYSRAYYEGDRIRVVDGMLKKLEGRILRVNKRAQTAQVSVGVGGREVAIWLGFELIEKNELNGKITECADAASAGEGVKECEKA